tara:strand:+ start:1852 stop:2034 length:183 start_codon:yes stop_codon:yes gene_type:complete
MKIHKKLRYVVGIFFIFCALFGALVGYDLKNIGENYNHIWALPLLSLWAGLDWINKGLNN